MTIQEGSIISGQVVEVANGSEDKVTPAGGVQPHDPGYLVGVIHTVIEAEKVVRLLDAIGLGVLSSGDFADNVLL